jgi:hypothetical protein
MNGKTEMLTMKEKKLQVKIKLPQREECVRRFSRRCLCISLLNRGVIFLFMTMMATACQRQKPEDDVVVRANSEVLTLTDIVNDIPVQIRHRITKEELQDYAVRWINSQILYHEAKRRKLDESIDLRRELHRLERELLVNALLDQELSKPIPITDEAIRNYYTDNHEMFIRDADEIHVWHIKIGRQSTADSLQAEMRRGGDFAAVARQLAGSDSTKWNFYLTERETAPEIASQIFTMIVGAVSRPIRLDDGFHIFKIVEKLPAGSLRPLSQVRDEILAQLQTEKRQERYRQLLSEFKSNVVIETNFQMLERLPVDSLLTRASQPQ